AQLGVGLQVGRRLVPGKAEGRRRDDGDGHAVVDERRAHAIDIVNDVAGRQQGRRDRPGGIAEVNNEPGCGAGDSRYRGGAGVFDGAIRGGDMDDRDGSRIDHPDPYRRHRTGRCDELALNGERAYAGENVAARLLRADSGRVNLYLQEEVVDVDVR